MLKDTDVMGRWLCLLDKIIDQSCWWASKTFLSIQIYARNGNKSETKWEAEYSIEVFLD
jgi:hypothetical protein